MIFIIAERETIICCGKSLEIRKDSKYHCEKCGVKYDGIKEERTCNGYLS